MGKTRKRRYDRYTLEFKKMIVKLANNPAVMAKAVADTLGLHPVMVYRWQMEDRRGELRGNPHMSRQVSDKPKSTRSRKSEREKATDKKLHEAQQRIRQLERQLATRDDEIDLLKKARRFLAETK
ncbi:MAG: transposase [Pseudomonadota bacterium]